MYFIIPLNLIITIIVILLVYSTVYSDVIIVLLLLLYLTIGFQTLTDYLSEMKSSGATVGFR